MGFKKIASVLTSAFMVGSTMFAGFSAAAMYPAPFVDDGAANVAIVYGSHAAAQQFDAASALSISEDLSALVLEDNVDGDNEDSSTIDCNDDEGNCLRLEKSTDKFNLGDRATDLFTSAIDADTQNGALGDVLADSVFENDDGEEYDYTQELDLSGLQLTHFADNDFNDEEPVIGFNLPDGTPLMNYTLEFTPDVADGGTDWVLLEQTTIDMLGKEYYILTATNASTEEIELLDSASESVVNEGETVTVTVGDETYEVSVQVFSATEVVVTINGETLDDDMDEGDTEELADGSYLGIKNIRYSERESGVSQVTFSIGSGKIKLIDGDEIQINGEDISDVTDDAYIIKSYITQSGGDLQSITLEWKVDSDTWLGYGTDSTELTLPVFDSVKLLLGNWVVPEEEITSITPDSDDKFKIDTDVTDGSVSFNLLYTNATGTGFGGLGKDSNELLLTNATTSPTFTFDMDDHSWFVATWYNGDDVESYVLEVEDIDNDDATKNTTTIKSIASGSDTSVALDVGESDDIGIGDITITLQTADADAHSARFRLTPTGSGTVYGDRIVTAEGLKIMMPWNSATATTDGVINLTANPTSWTMNFTEEDEDGNINSGDSFTAALAVSSAETTVSSISLTDYETSDGSDDFEGYVTSELATRTLYKTGGDQDELEVTYHGDEAYAQVFIAQASLALGSGSSGSTIVPILDTEVSQASGKNLIVVGGSCVNTVAAELLGRTDRFCGAEWTTASGVGENAFLIKTYARPGVTGKVATLVAGWGAVDTQNAATALTTQDVDTTVGMAYTGTTADSITSM